MGVRLTTLETAAVCVLAGEAGTRLHLVAIRSFGGRVLSRQLHSHFRFVLVGVVCQGRVHPEFLVTFDGAFAGEEERSEVKLFGRFGVNIQPRRLGK